MGNDLRELRSIEELEQALNESNQKPVLLFKHSLTCPISGRAFQALQSYLKKAGPQVSYNLITVQTARPVSNEVSSRLEIEHETPQAILVREGHRIWAASHFEITEAKLEEAIRKATGQA